MKKLVGQTIALMKNIWLAKPEHEDSYVAKFIVDKRDSFSFGGLGVSWWYTKTGFKIVECMASILVESRSEFTGCDLESTESVIKETLTEVCIDSRIFNGAAVCFSHQGTLFDHKIQSIGIYEFGEIIVNEISARLRKKLAKWCTLYVAPRICGQTFDVPQIGVSVVNREDSVAWNKIVAANFDTNGWSPETGAFQGNDFTSFTNKKYDYLFLVEEEGTQKGSQFASQLKLRKLFGLYMLRSATKVHIDALFVGQNPILNHFSFQVYPVHA